VILNGNHHFPLKLRRSKENSRGVREQVKGERERSFSLQQEAMGPKPMLSTCICCRQELNLEVSISMTLAGHGGMPLFHNRRGEWGSIECPSTACPSCAPGEK
jgi:hypothetical protein